MIAGDKLPPRILRGGKTSPFLINLLFLAFFFYPPLQFFLKIFKLGDLSDLSWKLVESDCCSIHETFLCQFQLALESD